LGGGGVRLAGPWRDDAVQADPQRRRRRSGYSGSAPTGSSPTKNDNNAICFKKKMTVMHLAGKINVEMTSVLGEINRHCM
jgi:hypothetical protein